MTSDIIEIWAGILGLAYLAAAGIWFGRAMSGKPVVARRARRRDGGR